MNKESLRLLGHMLLAKLEAIDKTCMARRPQLASILEDSIEEVRSMAFRMVGTSDHV